MSTYKFKNSSNSYTMLNNVFIDNYMAKARGEFIKVYILGLRFMSSGELGISSEILASNLNLLETDVLNAWNYWNDENVIKIIPIDNMGNYNIEFLEVSDVPEGKEDNINLLEELNKNSTKDMLQDIEKLLGRPLSSIEMTMYISWLKDFVFSPELILLLIQYCASKGKTDCRYIEKIALAWFDSKIKTLDDAQVFIKKHEDKWINIRKILNYLGIKDAEIMKPQEEMLNKWINTYRFSTDVIFKACDVCFQRINKSDFKYIDGILSSWYKDEIKTVEDVDRRDLKKDTKKSNYNNNSNAGFKNNNYNKSSNKHI